MDARTNGRTDNVKTVYPLQTKFAGGGGGGGGGGGITTNKVCRGGMNTNKVCGGIINQQQQNHRLRMESRLTDNAFK